MTTPGKQSEPCKETRCITCVIKLLSGSAYFSRTQNPFHTYKKFSAGAGDASAVGSALCSSRDLSTASVQGHSTAPLRSARKGSLTLCTKNSVFKVGTRGHVEGNKCLVSKKKKKKNCIWFPTPISGSSQPPIIPAPGDLIPSPGIHECFYHVEYKQKNIN